MEYTFVDLWLKETHEILRDRILLTCGNSKNTYFLHLSNDKHLIFVLNSDNPFCFLGESTRNNTAESTPLLALMKQHLFKSRITDIILQENDRVIFFDFEKETYFNEIQKYTLILECIPRYENLILVRNEKPTKMILDCHKRIHESESSYRQLYPGIPYTMPPKIEKPYIFSIDKKRFVDNFAKTLPENWKDFVSHFSNTPKFIKDLFTPKMSANEMWELISIITRRISNWSKNDPLFYHPGKRYASLFQMEGAEQFQSVNTLFQFIYDNEILGYHFLQLKQGLLSETKKQLSKVKRTLSQQQKDLTSLENADEWRKFGELLKVNLHLVKEDVECVCVIDYFSDEQEEIKISIDPELSPQQNMEKYFKKYKKAITGKRKLEKNIKDNKKQVIDLEELITTIESSTRIEELESLKKIKPEKLQHKGTASFKRISIKVAGRDWNIFAGRSGKENDELTLHFAKPDDWFFHTRVYHGTHVIVRNPDRRESLPDKVIAIAAGLAAYFSKAKHSTKVPVDYTQVRYVTKPRKSAPGFVVYKNNKTIFVDPIDPRSIAQ